MICYGQERARKNDQDPGVDFNMSWSGPIRTIKIQQYDLLWSKNGSERFPKTENMIYYVRRAIAKRGTNVGSGIYYGQEEPSRPGNTICYDQEWVRKTDQDPGARFSTAKNDQIEPKIRE